MLIIIVILPTAAAATKRSELNESKDPYLPQLARLRAKAARNLGGPSPAILISSIPFASCASYTSLQPLLLNLVSFEPSASLR